MLEQHYKVPSYSLEDSSCVFEIQISDQCPTISLFGNERRGCFGPIFLGLEGTFCNVLQECYDFDSQAKQI